MSAIGPAPFESETVVDDPNLGVGPKVALVADQELAPLGELVREDD